VGTRWVSLTAEWHEDTALWRGAELRSACAHSAAQALHPRLLQPPNTHRGFPRPVPQLLCSQTTSDLYGCWECPTQLCSTLVGHQPFSATKLPRKRTASLRALQRGRLRGISREVLGEVSLDGWPDLPPDDDGPMPRARGRGGRLGRAPYPTSSSRSRPQAQGTGGLQQPRNFGKSKQWGMRTRGDRSGKCQSCESCGI
jgi:hypothetical protein